MLKKVALIACVLVAAGSVAAVSSPDTLDDLVDGVVRTSERLSQRFMGEGTESGAPGEDRRGRRNHSARSDAHEELETRDSDRGNRPGRQASRRSDPSRDQPSTDAQSPRGKKQSGDRADDQEPSRAGGLRRRDERDPGRESKHGARREGMELDFGALDRNGDGVIDAEEFAAAYAERIAAASRRFFKRYDADRDGKVTREEFSRFARERSATLDLD
jgi:hypothetical protein